MNTPSRLVSLAALFLCASALATLSASQVTFRTEGNIVGAWGPLPALFVLEPGAETVLQLEAVFAKNASPIEQTPESATYAAVFAQGSIDGADVLLSDATLTVARDESFGVYSYLLQGFTPEGWVLWAHGYSDSPEFVPALTVPTHLPEIDAYVKWDIGCREAGWLWECYSDGAPTSLEAVTGRALPPLIRRQPASLTVAAGQQAQFKVLALRANGAVYQWYQDGRPVAGGERPRLRLRDVAPEDAGRYQVVVRTGAGVALSNPAVLTVR